MPPPGELVIAQMQPEMRSSRILEIAFFIEHRTPQKGFDMVRSYE
jgi:hypothetical protein